jgi:hypothetical protein
MSNKVISVLGALIVGATFLGGATQGCGGGGGTNYVDLCNRGCQKTVECSMGFVTDAQCKNTCMMQTMSTGGQRCTNEAAIVSKFNECLGMAACDAFLACLGTLPACQGAGTGAAGTSATGGAGRTGTGAAGTGAAGTSATGAAGTSATGAAGTAGSTCATACTKADACCMAAGQQACGLKAACDGAGADSAQYVSICNQFLAGVASNPQAPAACK